MAATSKRGDVNGCGALRCKDNDVRGGSCLMRVALPCVLRVVQRALAAQLRAPLRWHSRAAARSPVAVPFLLVNLYLRTAALPRASPRLRSSRSALRARCSLLFALRTQVRLFGPRCMVCIRHSDDVVLLRRSAGARSGLDVLLRAIVHRMLLQWRRGGRGRRRRCGGGVG